MKTNMKVLVGSSLALGLALAVWSPLQAQSADTTDGAVLTDAQLATHCKEMKEARTKLRDDAKAQDALLTQELAAMNGAPDDKKVGLMAALLTRVIEQRIAMDTRRTKMEDGMMHHMMQHIQTGKDSMPRCPMMKGDDDNSPGVGK